MSDSASVSSSAGLPTDTVPLSRLKEGQRGRLHSANLPCEDCDLLNAMGMTEACEIRVCQRGNPCIVQVNTTRLGLSRSMASNIFVTVQA
jgi:Fe2+ transport system protein FeoA